MSNESRENREASLSPVKRALLERLKRGKAVQQEVLSITRREEAETAVLSFAQQRLWFLEQLHEPDLPAYNIPTATRFKGQLDIPALTQSLNQVIQRHEILRTTFHVGEEKRPFQRITPSLTIPLPITDLSPMPAVEQERVVNRLITQETQIPFDLSDGPLLRARLFHLAPNDHILFINMHHIISDGWSTGVFTREIALLYESLHLSPDVSPLPPLPIQYADFALWQRQQLQGDLLETQLVYWKRQLGGALPILELPTDRPRPPQQTFRGGLHTFTLPNTLVVALKTLAQKENSTLFMVLLAAFKVLLHRYTNQEDILVGSPIASRNQVELENLIGFFVNTLVFRTDLSGDPSFRELLRRVRQVTLGAYANQDLPFDKLVEELRPERNLSYNPIFQVIFALQNTPIEIPPMPGLTANYLPVETGTTKFDMTWLLEETAENLTATIEYSTDLFDAATIARFSDHFRVLLTGIAANPDEVISRLPLLTPAEHHQLLHQWSNSQTSYLPDHCIHQRFEAQAAQTPDAIALTFQDTDLTYAELNEQANQLAHHLQKLGVEPEVLVGICLERSLEMMVAVLAVLKAGGGYVPLDPAYPPERLSFILKDADIPVLLTQSYLLPDLPEKTAARIICLDTDWAMRVEADDSLPTENPHSHIQPHHVAYVIYTSGSTGKPKGVLVSHYNVVRLFQATDHWYNFNNQDVWTLFHSYAFDFSVWEMWGALLYGGRLVVVPYWVSRSPDAFYDLLCRQKVTVLNQTPSAFRQLMRAEEKVWGRADRPFLALRYVIFGGEALELNSLRPWFERHGDERPFLINMYGITETTVHVTYRPIRLPDLETAPGSVIGHPIPDLQIYILDQNQQPVPIGVPGEIYVGGAGVAHGYLNRPELTAQRFIPVNSEQYPVLTTQYPVAFLLSTEYWSLSTVYRTGDLARWLPDGDIEYLGRIDQQVKIRGFRIELGEIESTLTSHPAVREALVVARQDEQDNKQLVAYIVPRPNRPAHLGDIRLFLKTRLPDYMVPAHLVLLDAFPLTNNGKIDRRALPAPANARPEVAKAYVPPQTAVEQTLADIWAEVLHVRHVGIEDNFFDLGGDSIRSIQVLYQAQEKGLNLTLPQLFQYQTISQLARSLQIVAQAPYLKPHLLPYSLVSQADWQKLPDGFEDVYPLTRLQAGMLFHSELTPETAVYLNITALRIQAVFDEAQLETAVLQLMARHPILRTSFDMVNYSEPLQLVHRHVPVPLTIVDLRSLPPAEQETALVAWMEAEKQYKFNYAQPPLFRLHIHRLSDDTFQLGLTEHHAILDGWSVASLLTELFAFYTGQDDHPAPATPFAEFVALERRTLADPARQAFWAETVQDAQATSLPRWPVGRADQPEMRYRDVPLPEMVAEGLKEFARLLGVPLKTVLLAAHMRMLSVLAGQTDVVTGIVVNGRPETADSERTLGLFLNTVPLRLQLHGGTWADLVQQTFTAEQAILPHRRYPLADIQQLHGGQPLFETIFNYIHFHILQKNQSLAGLQVLDEQFFGVTNYPFSVDFELHPATSRLLLVIEYDAAEFGGEQIETIAGYYARTLSAMATTPFGRYEYHSPLSNEERNRLFEWSETAVSSTASFLSLPALFEAQAAQTPAAIALTAPEGNLTYAELNSRANQLAHHLQTMGVGPETIVGLHMGRSQMMAIGLLGILKAGAAYLPLDPAYPADRLAFMLQDSAAPILLTSHSPFTIHHSPFTIIDLVSPAISQHPTTNPANHLQPHNLAYIIYTSGSTGTPKGVMVTQAGVMNYVTAVSQKYALSPADRVLQFAALSFDVAVEEIFPTWLTGGTVVLRPDETAVSFAQFNQFIAQQNITVLNLPAQYWQTWLADLIQTQTPLPNSLRLMIVGSEEVSADSWQQWRKLAGNHIRWINAYGPTEATIGSTFYEPISSLQSPIPSVMPIGRPLANTQAYILDAHLQPAPIGSPGELYIGGVGVARGYLNRPGITAEKFIPNPFEEGREKGEERFFPLRSSLLLYHTGDMACYLPDGNIQFLGRADQQVKVRGFRVELGEIEAALRQHSAVSQAVVLVVNHQLVAYVVGETADSTALHQFLQNKLPSHMLPAHFVQLPNLPLLPNGKLDRRALQQISPTTAVSTFATPRNATEQTLADIWAEVLSLPQVGIDQNFFQLGGHSLLVAQVISRVRQALGVDLPLKSLFNAPTVAELAVELIQIEAAQLSDAELTQLLAGLED